MAQTSKKSDSSRQKNSSWQRKINFEQISRGRPSKLTVYIRGCIICGADNISLGVYIYQGNIYIQKGA